MSKKPQKAVDEFNAEHPIGTPVLFWPWTKSGPGRESETRTPAWVMGGHSAMVSVEDYAGGIALTHVEAREPQP